MADTQSQGYARVCSLHGFVYYLTGAVRAEKIWACDSAVQCCNRKYVERNKLNTGKPVHIQAFQLLQRKLKK